MENNRSALANAILVLVTLVGIFLIGFLIFGKPASAPFGPLFSAKATPDEILQMLKEGNERFSAGKSAACIATRPASTWQTGRTREIMRTRPCFHAPIPGSRWS